MWCTIKTALLNLCGIRPPDRAHAERLRVWQYRVDRATTADELQGIADAAIAAGMIADVEAMLDRKYLPPDEAAAWRLYRNYYEEAAE